VPVPSLLPYVHSLDQIAYDMIRGRRTVLFNVAGTRVGTPICFESIFARDVRAFSRVGAELIIVATNNSSFNRSVSEQHLAHTRMRALELRQWVIQVGLSGISAAVAPDGSMRTLADRFRETSMHATVRARVSRTLYLRVGDLFALLFAAVAGLTLAAKSLWATVRSAVRLAGRVRTKPT
jgi:apolipoprotein N-acyltransferase